MRRLVLAVAAFAALPLAAATRYSVDIETTGDALQGPHLRATVLGDGRQGGGRVFAGRPNAQRSAGRQTMNEKRDPIADPVTPSVSEGPGRTGGAPPTPPGPSLTLGVTETGSPAR